MPNKQIVLQIFCFWNLGFIAYGWFLRSVACFTCINPNRLLGRYSAEHYGEDNFLTSFICLLASCFLLFLDVACHAFKLTTNRQLNHPMKSVLGLMTNWG